MILPADASGSPLEVFRVFLRLGLTCFGGPVAHLAFFHEEFVVRRRWLDGAVYADLVALCQFLPGPASSQVGMAVGFRRAGWLGMCAAALGFTLPSAVLMIGFAYGVEAFGNVGQSGWLHGLKLATVAVVAQAIWSMAAKLCPDLPRRLLALLAAIVVLLFPDPHAQILVIALGAAAGWFQSRRNAVSPADAPSSVPDTATARAWGIAALTLFLALLLILPALSAALPGVGALRVLNGFYRVGSFVFGGGHVILPLLQGETVERGWLTNDRFLAGYGAAQALPGPLFTFAGYLGAVLRPPLPGGWLGGLLGLTGIFLPSVLLLSGVLPFWETLRRRTDVGGALRGANAVVVGVLLAAFYDPLWTSSVHNGREFALTLAVFGALVFLRFAPWLVVFLSALAGWLCLS